MTAKVLFVDDDEGNLVVCEAACREFSVLTAATLSEALAYLRSEELAVVIADQRMPEITGAELLEKVRQEQPDAVRILITAHSDLSAAIDAINRGQVRRYLKKPWEPDDLRAEIRDALDLYAMTLRLNAMELRLRETERVYSLGVIAAGIGHELRNPAAWIRDNVASARIEVTALQAQLAEQGALRQRCAEVLESLDDAEAGVKRILDIVQGIDLPARPSATPQEVLELGEVVRLTLKLVRGELKRRADLELQAQGSPFVLGSSTKIGQVVLNLVVNAMQALGDKPREESVVRVSLSAEGPWAQVQVADNGPGVAEEDRERIFDPFFTTKKVTGTGLGLAISRRIATELGGSLEVTRDERLGGALFTLKLPAVSPEP